jgi:DNA-binding MarR family transcriptional regulator
MRRCPDDELMEAMHELMHLASSLQRRQMPDEGLHPMEGRALGFFVRHPGSTQSDLAQHSGRDKGQLARLIALLKERDLLRSQPDENDRRVTRLFPTLAAQRLHDAIQKQRRQIAAQAASGMSAEDTRELRRLLALMKANLQSDPDVP